jgi:hypothetical protein
VPQSVTHLVHELRHTGVEASARVDLHLDAAQVSRRFPEYLRFVERDLASGNVPNVTVEPICGPESVRNPFDFPPPHPSQTQPHYCQSSRRADCERQNASRVEPSMWLDRQMNRRTRYRLTRRCRAHGFGGYHHIDKIIAF